MNPNLEFQLETAACLWEATLGLHSSNQGQDPVVHALQKLFEANGTSDVRMTIIRFTDECIADWKKVEATYRDCFDWDFVPQWLRERLSREWGLFLDRNPNWLDLDIDQEAVFIGKLTHPNVLTFTDWSQLAFEGGDEQLRHWIGRDVSLILARTEDGVEFRRWCDAH